MEEGQHARDGKENAVHDAKREAGLQHAALLIRREMQGIKGQCADKEVDLVWSAGGDGGAVFAGDAAQFVYACDQGPDEAQVDERDEACIVTRTVVGEEGCNCPGGTQHGDDEEDEDIGRGKGVVAGVDVDEVGEHTEGWDLEGDC
jgi:hypothetical protein